MMMDNEQSFDLDVADIPDGKAIFNPGTGAVRGTTESNAILNMQQFIQDAEVGGLSFHREADRDMGNGRFAFRVMREGYNYEIEIQMPGLPLDKVRYLGEDGQNIWDYPRLYKDGSSWVWKYGIIDRDDYINRS